LLYAIGRLRLLPRPLPRWAATLLLFLAYILPAGAMLLYAEHFFSARVNEDLFPLPWLADGLAVSLMLVWGTRTWPAVFLGSIFIWGVLRGDPAILVGVDAVGETLSVVIAVRIMRAWHFRRQLDRLADPLILLAGALAGRAVAELADIVGTVTGAWLTPHRLPVEFLQMATSPGTLTPAVTGALVAAMARWQVNALTGIALTVPVMLLSPRKLRHALRTRPTGLTCLGLLSVLWVAGTLALSATWTCWPLLLTALMLIAWAAIDFGALTAALCTLLFACTAAAAFSQGLGPLATADVMGSLAATWGFIGLLCCVSPVLTAILASRQHQDRRLAILAERHRSLFTANPTPAWVADGASGAILMANAEAIRRYGYTESEFLRMKVSELCAGPGAGAQPPSPDADLVAAPLVKHVTSDGRLIDVELVSTPLELDGRSVSLIHAVDMTDQQDLRRRLLATVDRESSRVSQELHDGLGQVLAGLAMGSESLLQRSERDPALDPAQLANLRELADYAQQAESQLFRLTSGASPPDDLRRKRLPDEERASAGDTAARGSRPHAGAPTEGGATPAPGSEGSSADRVELQTRGFRPLPYLGASALIVLACWACGALSHALASAHNSHFTYADARLAVPSLLCGAVIAVLLRGGLRYLPAVFVAMVLVRLRQMGEPLATASLLAALGAAGSCAVTAVLRRLRFSPALVRWQDPLLLCVAAAVTWALVMTVGILINAVLAAHGTHNVSPGVAALYTSSAVHGIRLTPALMAASARWWFDAVAGTVLVVPTLTLAATFRGVVRESFSELACWCGCLALWLVLLLAVPTDKVLLSLLTFSILLVVWAAARLGVALASLATLLFAMAAAGTFATHAGAFATADAATGVAYVWGFVGVLSVIGLFLAALLAEHNSRHRRIALVNQRYRSLFEGDPRPLWLHDARTGQILDANEPAARAYGYTMAEFTSLGLMQLLAPGTDPEVLAAPGDSAVGPVAMKHVSKTGSALDVEIWSYGTFLDGRRVSICFAHEVTERNTLRRLLFDRAELERRELAAQLRSRLAGPLAELRIVAHKLLLGLRRKASAARMRELLESFARQSRRAAEHCREAAQRLSPLQANCGNLVAALHALQGQIPNGAPLKISVVGESPLELDQEQSEHLYSLLSEILTRCQADRKGIVHVALRSFGHTVRVAIDADLQPSSAGAAPSLAHHPSVLLRVRAMGARLWERSIGGAHTRLICDYPV